MTTQIFLAATARPRGSPLRTPRLPEADWADTVLQGKALLARKARSFHLATAFLPADLRDDIAVVYAYCRVADDLADETEDPCRARAELDRLEAELGGEAPARPLVVALKRVAARHQFPLSHAQALLRGVSADLGVVRIPDDAALLTYCYQVASTVGLMLSQMLGARDPRAEPHAVDLGLAMQLTNIVRDVREDTSRNRVYLPATRLRAHRLRADELVRGTADRGGVHAVCLELLALADQYYRSAERGLAYIPVRARFGIAVAHRVYASIGWRIRRVRHHPLDGRMVVPWQEKLWRVAQAAGVTLRSSCPREVHHESVLHDALHDAPGISRARR